MKECREVILCLLKIKSIVKLENPASTTVASTAATCTELPDSKDGGGEKKRKAKAGVTKPRKRPRQDGPRLLLLSPKIKTVEELPKHIQELVEAEGAEPMKHTVELKYEHWAADQVIRAILPEPLAVSSSFEAVGHIAHMNLRDDHLPYKHLIGQVRTLTRLQLCSQTYYSSRKSHRPRKATVSSCLLSSVVYCLIRPKP